MSITITTLEKYGGFFAPGAIIEWWDDIVTLSYYDAQQITYNMDILVGLCLLERENAGDGNERLD